MSSTSIMQLEEFKQQFFGNDVIIFNTKITDVIIRMCYSYYRLGYYSKMSEK